MFWRNMISRTCLVASGFSRKIGGQDFRLKAEATDRKAEATDQRS
jgi:hypothetical protein